MKSMVVYDSRFGDTAQVARAIAEGLRASGGVELRSVQDAVAYDLDGVDLLVVGGPTHAHGLSDGLARWLASLPRGVVEDRQVAAFDTRYRMVRIFSGSAAHTISRLLRRAGATAVAQPERFFVLASQGPLADGELARATAWAEGLAARCSAPLPSAAASGEHRRSHP